MRIARHTLPAVCISIRREIRRLDSAVAFLDGGRLQCRRPPFRPRIAFSTLTTAADRGGSHVFLSAGSANSLGAWRRENDDWQAGVPLLNAKKGVDFFLGQ